MLKEAVVLDFLKSEGDVTEIKSAALTIVTVIKIVIKIAVIKIKLKNLVFILVFVTIL